MQQDPALPTDRSCPPLSLAVGGALALAAAMGIGRFVYTPILPAMAGALSLPASEAGLIASANFLGYLVGALAASAGGLPGSQRSWFLGALTFSAATTFAMGLTDSLPLFLVLRFLGGAASAFTLVFASALVLERLTASGRSGLSALHFAGVGSGIAGSAILIAVLSSRGASWQSLWFASAGATVALLAGAALLIPGKSGKETAQPAQKPVKPAASRGTPVNVPLLRLILAYGLFGFGYVVTATFISVIAKSDPALSGLAQWVWLIVGLTAAPSVYLWNRVAVRIGTSAAFSLACIVEAAGVAMSVSGGLWPLVAGAALLGATFMGITALGLTEARALTRGDPRRMLAVMTASFGLGQMIGPWLAGILHDRTGDFAAASYAAAAALVFAAFLGYQGRKTVAIAEGKTVSEDNKDKVESWPQLREQLLAEGKGELVEAIDTLIRDSRRVEAAEVLRQLASEPGLTKGPDTSTVH
ncbi:YbfB/YjiJ family MFS transporter [Roseibium sp.]|uniref:YbfB/YjiJ family MFS transporter n=1 Tax=Roseibium sp. TaxID=1936156 RepID=UPI003A973AEC